MAATKQKPKLLTIVGPTASGKSDLALKIAQQFDGEIIAADSRTIYKGMDIGTAKPSKKEQKLAPHWGIDLVEPGETFSAAKFKRYAEEKIYNIQKRGKLPVLVGGTGLYIDGVLFDFDFMPAASAKERQELEKLSVEQLQQIIKQKGYNMPQNSQNRRHLIRTIERKGQQGAKSLNPITGSLIIGLDPDPQELKARINKRIEHMVETGVVEEVKALLSKYGKQKILKSSGIGYKPLIDYLEGGISLEEAKNRFKKGDWQYARRQRTWFKRNKFINWFDEPERAYAQISKALNN